MNAAFLQSYFHQGAFSFSSIFVNLQTFILLAFFFFFAIFFHSPADKRLKGGPSLKRRRQTNFKQRKMKMQREAENKTNHADKMRHDDRFDF